MAFTEDQLRSKYSEEVTELKKQLKEKDRLLSKYKSEHGQLEIFFNSLKDNIEPVEPLSRFKIKKHKGESECQAVMHITDGHLGAVQEPSEIEDFNAFNYDICKRRQLAFAEKFVNWIQVQRTAYNIPNLSVLVTGDLISGDIHDELRITNEFPIPVQTVKAGNLLAEQITLLAPFFNKVEVHFISADNHSRLTKKPQQKEVGLNSMNYIVGEIAAMQLQKHINVEFNVYPMLEKVVKVLNLQYLISHGHNVKGWMGIPWYGIERNVGREAMIRMEIIMNELSRMKEIGFHKYIFGHFHTPFDHPHYACGGSVSGTDAYDHSSGRHSDPSQGGWLIHPKYGEFNRINFNLKYIL